MNVTAYPDPRRLYELVMLIRAVEERVIAEYPSRRIRTAVHLSIGQEGVAVGTVGHSRPTDVLIGTHRSHAFYLAKGGALQPFVDELYSLPTGCTGGRGGSMHLADPSVGFLGASAVLGGGVPIAVGYAFAAKARRQEVAAFALTGDGGIDEGSFFESLNLAALFHLPVIFVVENNSYSTLTPQSARQAVPDIVRKSEAFGVRARTIGGQDTVGVAQAVDQIVRDVRSGCGPFLIELRTHRRLAHVGIDSDWGLGRALSEQPDWESVDPLSEVYWKDHLPLGVREQIRASVLQRVDAAFHAAILQFDETNALACLAAPPPPNAAAV